MRKDLTEEQITDALDVTKYWLHHRLEQKGRGTFASTHEARGVIDEEFCELREAFHKADKELIANELIDLAVASIFTLACMRAGTMEW